MRVANGTVQVGHAGSELLVGLARAFARDASLVVLDGPTANVDATTAAQLGEAIARLLRGRTALLITHDRTLAGRCAAASLQSLLSRPRVR